MLGSSHDSRYPGNQYFHYGHGKYLNRKRDGNDGARTIMATSHDSHKKRINIFSNPDLGEDFGSKNFADNSRVLRFVFILHLSIISYSSRETRFLAASFHDSAEIEYNLKFYQSSCSKSETCIVNSECPDQLRPKNFLRKLCGEGKICCQNNRGIFICIQGVR